VTRDDPRASSPVPRVQLASELAVQFAQDAASRPPGAAPLLGYSLSPFDRLTEALAGLRRGFYYGLAGAPRRGKTNFALHIAAHVARNHGVPVLFYSWEQTARVLAARLAAREARLDPVAVLGGSPSLEPRLRQAADRLRGYGSRIFLVEAGRQDTPDRIRARARSLMRESQTGELVLVIDYLQKVPLDQPVDDWRARTDLVSTALAELSLELDIPVLAISPLDKEGCRLDERPPEEREDGSRSPYERPTMHHCVGAGDLEYDLDVALVLAKDWEATRELRQMLESQARAAGGDPDEVPEVDIVTLHIDKNRDAPESAASAIQYAFLIALNAFLELDYKRAGEYRPEFRSHGKLRAILDLLREAGVLPAPPARR
jgi:replicative DNA helicase